MREVFADTGYWIAMASRDDELKNNAVAVNERLGTCQIVTTEMVLAEFLNHMSRTGQYGRRLAVDTVMSLQNNSVVEVVPQTSAQFMEAVERYASRLDQRWSVTDCASFLLMEQRGITEALAFDRDFEQAGFVALLRDTDRSAR